MAGVDSVEVDLFVKQAHEVAAGFAPAMLTADDTASRLIGAQAQKTVPFATGELANSATFGAGLITYAAPHAVAVFGGTPTMVGRPWVTDAIHATEQETTALYVSALTDLLDETFTP